ncbi:Fcf2 pre-rRNA processing-domain-containing protein [Hyaloraphidium curvatum]|nr:Fcf2 pre-rRNA processing-domain-containing protein [Hyaloraphidium curvatum]
MSDDELLDSLLEAATQSLKRKRTTASSSEPPSAAPITTLLRKNEENETESESGKKKMKRREGPVTGGLEPPSAAVRADALRQAKAPREESTGKGGKKGAQAPATSGPKWFDLPAQEMTPEIKQHLQILNMRHVIDPKRHYKRPGKKGGEAPKFFQVGTLIEGAGEYYSARVPKRDRDKTLVDELLADVEARKKYKQRFEALQAERAKRGKLPIRGRGKAKKRR